MAKPNEGTTNLPAFLDAGIKVDGRIAFMNTLRVAGKIVGEVGGGKELIVDPGGSIEGRVKVEKLFVRGKIEGQEITVDRLEIFPEGQVEGKVTTRILVIHEGGTFQAECVMEKQKKARVTALER